MISMRWKRLFYYLLLNIIVTAGTMVAVLYAWERYRPHEATPLSILFPTSAPASELPVVEPTSVEFSGFEQYTVQPGDSLSAIADSYNVSIEEILAYNQLDNPDALPVGTVLSIPVLGGAVAAPTPVSNEPGPTELPAPTLESESAPPDSGTPELEVVTVIGAGDIAEERVVIRQIGEAQVSLQGWQIVSPGGDLYTFPQLVLFKDGAVTVYSKAGGNNVAELFWGLAEPVWATGDVVSLLDPGGNIVAAYQVP